MTHWPKVPVGHFCHIIFEALPFVSFVFDMGEFILQYFHQFSLIQILAIHGVAVSFQETTVIMGGNANFSQSRAHAIKIRQAVVIEYILEPGLLEEVADRVVSVSGARVRVRPIRPRLEMDTVQFYSQNMTDAVALASGRLTKWHVEKNSYLHKGDVILSMDSEQIPIKMQQAATNVRRAEAELDE